MNSYLKLIASCSMVVSTLGNFVIAQPAEKLVLRVADSFPGDSHWMVKNATIPWMEEVTRRSGGMVTFQHFPAEQLGKTRDMLRLTQSGAVDIGYVAPSFIADNTMPLTAVAELPGGFANACQGTNAYLSLATKGGILAEKDFAANGVRLLWAVTMPPYQIMTGNKKIESIKDLDGLKLRSAGASLEMTARKLKSVPVRLATPEIYDSLSRGTVDGLIFPFSSLFSYKLDKLVKYSTVEENFGAIVAAYVISEARWKSLPESVRQVMAEAGIKVSQETCAVLDRDLQVDIDRLKKSGMVTVSLPASDKQELLSVFANVRSEWAESLNQRGKPGTQVLKAFEAAVQQGR
ncbi:TRAP transporter substrate-binding protein DctP [Piscinibacter sakaiensis]|uniref:TRAP transporter substrate-binding protein n=1 Tax=Piscinibacter sakaiensis TaxID=1547922 RepID=UPI003AACCA9C